MSGTRPGSSPDGSLNSNPEPDSGLKPKEKPLAGYLMARAALHRKVEGQVLKNLRAGHATVQEVGELLPLGRANVREDIEKAKGPHLMMRNLAQHELRRALKASGAGFFGFFRREPKNSDNRRSAAAGQYAQTGTCGTHAAVTVPVHAAKLPEMKDKKAVVAKAVHASFDHAWAEMMPNGKGKDGKPILHGEDVVMDGWGKEKVAILREDGAFSRLGPDGRGDHIHHPDILNYKSGPKALESVEKYKARIENSPDLKAKFQSDLDGFVSSGIVVPEHFLYDATSVFSNAFRQEAGAALRKNLSKPVQGAKDVQKAKNAASATESEQETNVRNRAEHAKRVTLAEVRAIGVARSRGSDIRDAKAKAVQIHYSGKLMSEIQAAGVARSLGSNVRGAIAEAPGIIASAKEMFPFMRARTEGN